MGAMVSASTPSDEIRLQPVGEGGGEPVVLNGDRPALIGRSQQAAVCVVHPSVSRSHACLEYQGDGWFLTDLDSRHGTQVNGVELQANTPAPIVVGDIVRVGPVVFRVEIGEPSSRTLATTDGGIMAGTSVERVPSRELEGVARRRLDLLMEGAAVGDQLWTGAPRRRPGRLAGGSAADRLAPEPGCVRGWPAHRPRGARARSPRRLL